LRAVGALKPRTIVVLLVTTPPGVRLVRGHAPLIDLEAKTVPVARSSGADQRIPYDRLVLAPGGVTRLLDSPGLSTHALGFKTVAGALYLRDLVLQRMEQANDELDAAARGAVLEFVVVGAGYAGTELVVQMSRLATRLLTVFPALRAPDINWTSLDMTPAVMPELGEELGLAALALLRQRGIGVRLRTSVSKITADYAELTDGTTINGEIIVWRAGVAANPLMASTGLATTKGRLDVDSELRVTGRDDRYALGDAAAVPDLSAAPDDHGIFPMCPPTAKHAMRQGRAVARNVIADVRGERRHACRHRDLGLVVDLGGTDSVPRPPGLAIRGRSAKLVTRVYHLYSLPTGRRRIRAVVECMTAGRTPDDVAFDLPDSPVALAAAEHAPNASGTGAHR